MTRKEQGFIKIARKKDEKGRTVFLPLTKADKRAMESGLKNKKGLIIGEPLEDSKQCPLELDSDLPFEISVCGIEAETEDDKKTRKRLARQLWEQGNKSGAEELLGEALEEG